MFDRLVSWLEDKSDWLSPLVVKEVRQVVRGREFSLSFGASLVAGLFVAFLGTTDAMAGGTAGRWTFAALMFCLAFLGLAVVPLGAFGALRREQVEQTIDLITLTALSARRVVVGKLMAQAVRLMTLFAAIAPFVAMSFVLGGIDFLSIVISLVLLFMASLWMCAVCIFLSTVAKTRALSAVVFVAVGLVVLIVAGLTGSAFRALSMGAFFITGGGSGATASQLFWTLAIATSAWAVMLVNLVLLAVNRLSLPTDDSVTYLRIGFLAQLLVLAGWSLVYLFDPVPAPRVAGGALAVLGGLHLLAFTPFAATESPVIPRRAQLAMQAASLRGRLVRLFGPGGGRGPANVLLHLTILAATLAFFPIDADDRRHAFAAYGYLCFIVAIPTVAFRWLMPERATPTRLRVAVLVVLAVLTALPDLLHYLIWQPEVLDLGYNRRHLLSPLQTVFNWRIVERSGWAQYAMAIGLTGIVAMLALVPTGMREARDSYIEPRRPASAAGDSGNADLIY